MTMPIRFDTQQYIKTLIEGGHSQEQAEAQAQALTTALGEGTVASSELLMVKVELSSRMDALKAELLARVDLIQTDVVARIDLIQTELLARIDLIQTELLARMELLKVEILAAVDRKLLPLYIMQGIQTAALLAVLLKLYG